MSLSSYARELHKEASDKYSAGRIAGTLRSRLRTKAPKMNAGEKYEQAARIKKALGGALKRKGQKQGLAAGALVGGTTVALATRRRGE